MKDSPAANDKDDDLLFMRGHSLVDSQQIQDPTEAGGEHKRKQKQTFLYLAAALDAIAVTTAINMKRCRKSSKEICPVINVVKIALNSREY